MPEFIVINREGIVEQRIAIDAIDSLLEIYTEHQIVPQVGDETIGWTFDGVTFTGPQG